MKRLIATGALSCGLLSFLAPLTAQEQAAFEVVSVKPDVNPAAQIGIRHGQPADCRRLRERSTLLR